MVGKLNANSDGQYKETQQDIKGKLERFPISEYAKHIEVQGHESHRQQKHDGDKDAHLGGFPRHCRCRDTIEANTSKLHA